MLYMLGAINLLLVLTPYLFIIFFNLLMKASSFIIVCQTYGLSYNKLIKIPSHNFDLMFVKNYNKATSPMMSPPDICAISKLDYGLV